MLHYVNPALLMALTGEVKSPLPSLSGVYMISDVLHVHVCVYSVMGTVWLTKKRGVLCSMSS